MFGPHTPYVIAAYGATFIAIGGLIAHRLLALKQAQKMEESAAANAAQEVD